jgi:hypothetical protein
MQSARCATGLFPVVLLQQPTMLVPQCSDKIGTIRPAGTREALPGANCRSANFASSLQNNFLFRLFREADASQNLFLQQSAEMLLQLRSFSELRSLQDDKPKERFSLARRGASAWF